MSYSVDLRKRVISFVQEGGSKAEASRIFDVSLRTVFLWMKLEDLTPRNASTRHRKLDKSALRAHVQAYPDAILRERAQHFGVHPNAIWVALRRLDIVKKNDEIF